MRDALRRAWEISHVVRAVLWIPITAYVLSTDLKSAVWVVIAYSAYANIASDLGAWEGSKARRAATREGKR